MPIATRISKINALINDGPEVDSNVLRAQFSGLVDDIDNMAATVAAQREYIEKLQERSDILDVLEAHGVDNWDGYGMALDSLD